MEVHINSIGSESIRLAYLEKLRNALSKYVTNSNEEYKVLGISGTIYYNEDYDNCIINRDEVVEELSNIYKNSNQEKIISKDPFWEEKLVEDEVYFSLVGGGSSEASCIKIEKNFPGTIIAPGGLFSLISFFFTSFCKVSSRYCINLNNTSL